LFYRNIDLGLKIQDGYKLNPTQPKKVDKRIHD